MAASNKTSGMAGGWEKIGKMKINIVVGGRFHSDKMALAFAKAGHEVRLFTTLPRNRFPCHPHLKIFSFPLCEAVHFLGGKLGLQNTFDHLKISLFGKLVRETIRWHGLEADLLIGWSSFSLETLWAHQAKHQVLIRDSSHIEYQLGILEKEYRKLGLSFPKRHWVKLRELAEYEEADEILVLSQFAKRTFEERGAFHIKVLRLGVETEVFSRKPKRCLNSNDPIKLVHFGSLSVRKGIHYLLESVSRFDPGTFEVHLIGAVEKGYAKSLAKFSKVKLSPPMKQKELAEYLKQMDLFVLPSLEDGFGQTLIQAMAVGLPVITTPSCGATELVEHGVSGIVVPTGDVSALTEALERLRDTNTRERLGEAGRERVAGTGWKEYEQTLQSWARDWEQGLPKNELLGYLSWT